MANLSPDTVVEMRVGDVGRRLRFIIAEPDEIEVRDLTGYAAWVSFWNPGSAPHIIRSASLDPLNGLVIYTMLGDELTTEGETFCQATVQMTDYHIGSAPGRAFLSFSADYVRIRTLGAA